MSAQTEQEQPVNQQTKTTSQTEVTPTEIADKILCPHCLRTATNGIKCKGICVADSDY